MASRITTLIVAMACLSSLASCASSTKTGGLSIGNGNAAPNAAANGEATGALGQPAAAAAPAAKAGLRPIASEDDLQRGKRYFAANNYDLAAESFRSATEKHPSDAKAWIGLATAYDRLHRFDVADRAYAEAIRLAGETAEILNDEGYSYMLRGDYARAQKTLEAAEAKDPANPYVQANMQLLEQSYYKNRAIE
jgi:Flp pilus assembly protein TadD